MWSSAWSTDLKPPDPDSSGPGEVLGSPGSRTHLTLKISQLFPSRKWEQEEPTADMVSQTNSWLWSWSRFWPWCFWYLSRSLVWPGLLVHVQVTGPFSNLVLAIFPGRSICPGPCSVGGGLKFWQRSSSGSGPGLGPGSCSRLRLCWTSQTFQKIFFLTLRWQSEPPVGSSVAENSWLDEPRFPPVSAPHSHCGGYRKPGGTNLAAHRFDPLYQQ